MNILEVLNDKHFFLYKEIKNNISSYLRDMKIQAVLFDKNYWDKESSKDYLKIYNFHPIKRVHITNKYYRYRLLQPDYDKNNYFIKRGVNHIDYIIEIEKK